jgi:hypothetical protein
MVCTHTQAITWFMIGLIFGLQRDPRAVQELGPLCLGALASEGSNVFWTYSSRLRIHDNMAMLATYGNPTDDAATLPEENISSIYSSAERGGCRQKWCCTVWIAMPRGWPVWQERKCEDGKRCYDRSTVNRRLLSCLRYLDDIQIMYHVHPPESQIQYILTYCFITWSHTTAQTL